MSQGVETRPGRRVPAAKLVSLDERPATVLNEVAQQVAQDPTSRPVLFLDLEEQDQAGDVQAGTEEAVHQAVERAAAWLSDAFAYDGQYRATVAQAAQTLAGPGAGDETRNVSFPIMAVVEPTTPLWGAERARLADAGGYIVRRSQEISDARSPEEKEAALSRYLTNLFA